MMVDENQKPIRRTAIHDLFELTDEEVLKLQAEIRAEREQEKRNEQAQQARLEKERLAPLKLAEKLTVRQKMAGMTLEEVHQQQKWTYNEKHGISTSKWPPLF